MITVRNVLNKKERKVWSVSPDDTILTALKLMAETNVGALMVLEGGKLVGIFSERDYARRGILQNHGPDTKIHEVLTPLVYYVTPEQTIDDCMALMTDKHIRHLPVMVKDEVIGVISIGDVVNSIIDDQIHQIKGLEKYIMGG
jgi:CBS domain-containing protein